MSDRRSDAQRHRDEDFRIKHNLIWSGCDLPLSGLEFLIDSGLLDVERSNDKHAVKAALSEFLWRLFRNPAALDRLTGLKR